MKTKDLLNQAALKLSQIDTGCPQLEAEILLRHLLKISRAQIYCSLNDYISPCTVKDFDDLLQLRMAGKPVPYICGYREFYGLHFHVDSRVLIPRPETELLVEETLRAISGKTRPVICDLGTGCGAIAISIALNNPEVFTYALDISAASLEVADINCRLYCLEKRLKLVRSDLLLALPEPVDVIVANLPYVKTEQLHNVPYEPRLALDGGDDGLVVIKRLLGQFRDYLKSDGCLIMEIGQGQAHHILSMLVQTRNRMNVRTIDDLAGIPRMMVIKLENDKLSIDLTAKNYLLSSFSV